MRQSTNRKFLSISFLLVILVLALPGLSQTGTSGNDIIEKHNPDKKNVTKRDTFDGEDNCLTPFNKKSKFNNFAIIFKILPWISFPSGSGINPSSGFEYGFAKNQSIGIDLYYNQYSFSTPEIYDSLKMNISLDPEYPIEIGHSS
jgi:hypothetical protein